MRFLGIQLFFVSPSSAALVTRFGWRESALPVCVHQRDASVDADNRREAPPSGACDDRGRLVNSRLSLDRCWITVNSPRTCILICSAESRPDHAA